MLHNRFSLIIPPFKHLNFIHVPLHTFKTTTTTKNINGKNENIKQQQQQQQKTKKLK